LISFFNQFIGGNKWQKWPWLYPNKAHSCALLNRKKKSPISCPQIGHSIGIDLQFGVFGKTSYFFG
jgi:hypothetical protein